MSGKILVVDDDSEVRMTTRDFLASRGHAVSVAAGGREALAMLEAVEKVGVYASSTEFGNASVVEQSTEMSNNPWRFGSCGRSPARWIRSAIPNSLATDWMCPRSGPSPTRTQCRAGIAGWSSAMARDDAFVSSLDMSIATERRQFYDSEARPLTRRHHIRMARPSRAVDLFSQG